MTYEAPIKDMILNIAHIAQNPGDLGPATTMLKEFGRFCAEETSRLNASGDREGSRYEQGHVHPPAGLRKSCAKCVAHLLTASTHKACAQRRALSDAGGRLANGAVLRPSHPDGNRPSAIPRHGRRSKPVERRFLMPLIL
jgi:hypothetical protein